MSENLVAFLSDANDFVVTFRTVIESSVPHIYLSALPSALSALPSAAKVSKIAEVFIPKYPSLLRITATGFPPTLFILDTGIVINNRLYYIFLDLLMKQKTLQVRLVHV